MNFQELSSQLRYVGNKGSALFAPPLPYVKQGSSDIAAQAALIPQGVFGYGHVSAYPSSEVLAAVGGDQTSGKGAHFFAFTSLLPYAY